MITVSASELNKKFNSYTLGVDSVSFAVKEGEVFGIIGPNAAGKTTIIKTLMGLIKPTKGATAIMQRDAFQDGHIGRMEVGYMGSEVSYFPNKTVYISNFSLPVRMRSSFMARKSHVFQADA